VYKGTAHPPVQSACFSGKRNIYLVQAQPIRQDSKNGPSFCPAGLPVESGEARKSMLLFDIILKIYYLPIVWGPKS
jgi:hypothetical protein